MRTSPVLMLAQVRGVAIDKALKGGLPKAPRSVAVDEMTSKADVATLFLKPDKQAMGLLRCRIDH